MYSSVNAALQDWKCLAEAPLILNRFCLKEVPRDICLDQHCCEYLKELHLRCNSISSLSSQLVGLRSLTRLYLSSNRIKAFPEVLCHLPCLEVLNLESNFIADIPPSAVCMPHLQRLHLGCNYLTSLPDELWTECKLEMLDAHDNQLTSLSPTIIFCQSLKKLILDCNNISSLPKQLGRLPKLAYLSLSGNCISTLPNVWCESLEPRILLLDSNLLSEVPSRVLHITNGNGGMLGITQCHTLHYATDNMKGVAFLRVSDRVLPLVELAARTVRCSLVGCHVPSSQVDCWLPNHLGQLLHMPVGVQEWLVPSGCCEAETCKRDYFLHHVSIRMSVQSYKEVTNQPSLKFPNDLAVSAHFCSLECLAHYYSLTSIL